MPLLRDLLVDGVQLVSSPSDIDAGDLEIADVVLDSRAVRPGALFIAIPGTRIDGAKFIPEAIAGGAVAVLCASGVEVSGDAAVLRSDSPRRATAHIAARFFARQPATIAAVTGTSGKTSVADFTRQIFAHCGRRAASIGTIGIVKPDGSSYGSLTTPDPVSLHRCLADLADEGVTHLAFEASSHGLDQHRLDGVRISVAAFTNLGRDHLDYHPTVEAYFVAKRRLFEVLLPETGTAVINVDDPFGQRIESWCDSAGRRKISVSRSNSADLTWTSTPSADGEQLLDIVCRGRPYRTTLHLLGDYQAQNAVLAAAMAIAAGEDPATVFAGITELKGVAGRLEPVGRIRGVHVLVDYAHKPEALEAALSACRAFTDNRLICVFGCGGDRDKGKRPIMGAIAAKFADVTIVTDDNPRTERPEVIRAEILAEAPDAIEIGDRAAAIRAAIAMAGPGDVVLIAGKGHETGQIVGDQVLPFSDQDAVRSAIADEVDRA